MQLHYIMVTRMLLKALLEGMTYQVLQGVLDINIKGLAYDSRKVTHQSVFVAIKGFETDGHLYLDEAISQGAVAVVVNQRPAQMVSEVTYIQMPDTRLGLALMSCHYFAHPTQSFKLLGITGTNGKTSITIFVKSILEASKKETGIIGTMGVTIGKDTIQTKNTTPESYDLQHLFHIMAQQGIDYVAMEVSSHALALSRVAGCDFNGAIFSNLTPDHLELHQDMEQYFQAKSLLFHMTNGPCIINYEDPYGQRLIRSLGDKSFTYGLCPEADVYCDQLELTKDGSSFILHYQGQAAHMHIHIPGQIFVMNALAAAAFALTEGIDFKTIASGLAQVNVIKGRMETIYDKMDKKVVIDFAHSEDGLEKTLKALKPFVKNRLLLVFGVYASKCSHGEAKRKAMVEKAATYADYVIATTDNPKTQDPFATVEALGYYFRGYVTPYILEVDREKAIKIALDLMTSGDVLLISGKGHETAQMIGHEAVPFNEREIVLRHMQERGSESKCADL